jgi:hypothetical protein
LDRVDVRLIRGKFLKSALRNAWTSFKDEGTLEGGAMFLESPDNKGAGVGYRCGDIDGQKLETYQTSLGFFDPAITAPSMKAALEVALDLGHYAFLRSSNWLRAGFQTFATKLGDPRRRSSRLP